MSVYATLLRLREHQNDPMWADHAEVSKKFLQKVGDDYERMIKALEPFALYADETGRFPDDMVITLGSSMAKHQLTMGQCRLARTIASLPVA